MKRSYSLELSSAEIKELQKHLREYNQWLEQKAQELCKRLAEIGVNVAAVNFETAIYDGINDAQVRCVAIDNGYKVEANGKTVLFIEFGSGMIGEGYPPEELNGMGPGTYSDTVGKGHWDDPNGWYYAHGKKSYGNPPNMPMYNAMKEVELAFERVVKEVFST